MLTIRTQRKTIPQTAPKIVRVSAGALLLAEKKTTVELQRHVRDASKMASGELASQGDRKKNAILLMLLLGSRHLQSKLDTTLHAAKKRSREVGAARLRAELRDLGARDAAANAVLSHSVVTDVQASTSAEALALAWRQKAIYDAMKAEREERSIAEALARVQIDMNVSRTGATESAQAYNEGHAAASEGLDMSGLVDRWEAMLDACPQCVGYDGDTADVGQPFESGAEPGLVHVRCRCMRVTARRIS